MGAYNRTNEEPCCAHSYLMEEVLRDKWHFEGHYVSDCWAIRDFHEGHHVTAFPEDSAALALEKGCDLNCGCTYEYILQAYKQGKVTEEEIRMMVDLGGQRGAIDEDEQEWIQNVFEFGDMTVREAMTPRGDVEAFSADASREEVLETIRRTGLSRFPVYEGTVDTIAGVLNTRDFLLSVGSGEEKTVRELMLSLIHI